MEINYIYKHNTDDYYSVTVDKNAVEALMDLILADAKNKLNNGETEKAYESLEMWVRMRGVIKETDE